MYEKPCIHTCAHIYVCLCICTHTKLQFLVRRRKDTLEKPLSVQLQFIQEEEEEKEKKEGRGEGGGEGWWEIRSKKKVKILPKKIQAGE